MLTPGRKAVNSPVQIRANFQDEDRVDIDPDTVTFRVRSPCGVERVFVYGTDAALIKASTGDYYIDFVPDRSGQWHYRWESTGVDRSISIEGKFLVQHSPFYDDVGIGYR